MKATTSMKIHLYYSPTHEDWRVIIHTDASAHRIRFNTKAAAEKWIKTDSEKMMKYIPEGE